MVIWRSRAFHFVVLPTCRASPLGPLHSASQQLRTKQRSRDGVYMVMHVLLARTQSRGPSLPSGKAGNCGPPVSPGRRRALVPSGQSLPRPLATKQLSLLQIPWTSFSFKVVVCFLHPIVRCFFLEILALLSNRIISFCVFHQRSFSLGVIGIKFYCKTQRRETRGNDARAMFLHGRINIILNGSRKNWGGQDPG